ncbi:DNA-binding LacI/PurR family transcriptional regulator [Catenuloplanes nepalensis]|uniref:DNA-binding LacI/PurR family transcriptional regulator n=1 Tax=Catenuloplanes nepalensis TaxID=587533 RepID=A0ABT9N7S0_9ACTN|nr:LacI family DNA-binding transcriptional regulator [Catenuloplanes nepalensis]MDP9799748.1 DNA-binding LacI/PurR family transcriptional regulator [Catenuloplanes nepalensis]
MPRRRTSGPPIMADVARLAGVSHQTVSRVLNEHPNVRPETRDRVLAAIEELAYRRNFSARALVTSRTQTLGVVAFDTTLFGPASTLYGIEQAAREAGYFVSIVSLKSITRETVREALDYLAAQSVDGYIVLAPQQAAIEAIAGLPLGLPVVAVEGPNAGDVPIVAVDQAGGGALATQYLLDLGHRTVWHIGGPPNWLEADARVRGWESALTAAGAPVPPPVRGDWSPRSGYQAGAELATLARAEPGRITAIFVGNDQMALGALRALREADIRVPEDVSVVGFDDIPEAEFFPPPLTTVTQDFTEVGRRSMRMLLAQLDAARPDHPPGALRDIVPARLAIRSSTARFIDQ